MAPARVLMLPGGVLPADLAYAGLIDALGDDADAVAKDLELYRSEQPPPGWDLGHEVDGLLRAADARGWDTFHLVGYSGGGAVALTTAATRPERLLSLALLEPAWAGRQGRSRREEDSWTAFEALEGLPPQEYMAGFLRLNIEAGVDPPPPPPGPPPPWMARRPAGLAAFVTAFAEADIDPAALERFRRPVLYVLGGLSRQDHYGEIAKRLAGLFPDFTLEVFEGRHHFDPPHRVEPERLAAMLRGFWG